MEDILLRTAPPETYDAWVRHELPFNSPEIRRAFETMGQIWLNDEYVYGGRQGISRDNFQESPAHLFEDPPGCYLHRQASFALHLFPPGVEYGKDVDFFYLPPIDAKYGKPVLGGGDIFAMFNDRPEVRELMRYLTTAEAESAGAVRWPISARTKACRWSGTPPPPICASPRSCSAPTPTASTART